MGGYVKTLENLSPRVFLFVCLALLFGIFFGSAALHSYENKKAAVSVNEYKLALAARLSDSGFSDEEAAEMILEKATPDDISAGERILSSYGISADSPIGGEFVYSPHLASDILTSAGVLLSLIVGSICFNNVFGDIRKLTEQLEHERDITFSKEHDIGLLAEAADALRKQTAHLVEKLSDEKRYLADYLNDFSHQIKTPCTGLMLNNDILKAAPMPFEQQLEYLKRDRKCLERISLLVTSSLKLARLDAGAVEYNFEQTDISEPIAEAVAQLGGIACENDAELINETDRGITLNIDRLWFCEAVTNLVKNAAEHTHGGQVHIRTESDPMTVRIIIEDNGCGISEDELPKVFKRFYSKSHAVNSNSVGIGMSTAKRIVEDMNGRLFIESEPERGTKIILEFLQTVTLL